MTTVALGAPASPGGGSCFGADQIRQQLGISRVGLRARQVVSARVLIVYCGGFGLHAAVNAAVVDSIEEWHRELL